MDLSFRTNEIKLNIPTKVLVGQITSTSVESYWNYPNSTDDPWWLLGSTPRGYSYKFTIDITVQSHGSNLTRKPYQYNGMDIKVGDWLSFSNDGVCVKIVSVESKTDTSVTVIVEDYQRYNTFQNSNGSPIGSGSTVVIFELQESGLPLIDPLPSGPNATFVNNVSSRFIRQNVRDNIELYVEGNIFEKGQVLAADSNNIVLADSASTASKMIGVVSMSGPGPDYVTIRPHSKFVDYDTTIPSGSIGTSIFVANNGLLTTDEANSTGATAYIVVEEAVPTILTGTVNNPSFSTSAFSIILNDATINFNGTENLIQISSAINGSTSVSQVTSSTPQEENIVESSTLSLAYGLIGGYVPFSATINGVSVTFTDDYYGNIRYGQPIAAPEDIKNAIDAVNIPNLEVLAPGDGTLTIKELQGNAINIVNTGTDNTGTGGSGVGFAGTNSITGMPLTTVSTTNFRLRLTRANGGQIDIYDNSLAFETLTGVTSGQNGRPVVAAYVYDGLRTSSTQVVANIPARDALTPGLGDMAYVINDGTGSYAMYMWDGNAWKKIATEESAFTDARTYEVEYTVGDTTTLFLGNVSIDRKVESISAEVVLPFDDSSSTIIVGSSTDPDLLLPLGYANLASTDTYMVNPEYYTSGVSGQDDQFFVTIDPKTSSVGSVTVKITYI